MNINQVQNLFGDMNSQENKTLELKVGQVVRGVVTQQLSNQEAIVNINGVNLKARLEVPILEGKATLLEVAPDSKEGYIHLRQVDPTKMAMQDPMKDILKVMQLPDKDWANQLIRELRQEGFPLNRETLQAFAQAAKLAPAGSNLENWMQAATLAFKRGMPMTFSSIVAMQQLSQGQPLHQLVSQLQGQLTNLLQDNTTNGQQLSGQSKQLLQQLSQSLASLSQMNSAETLTQPQGTNQSNPIANFMKLLGVQHEQALGQQVLKGGEQSSSQNTSQIATNVGTQTPMNTSQTQGVSNANSQGSTMPTQMQQGSIQQATVQTDGGRAVQVTQQPSMPAPTNAQLTSVPTQADKAAFTQNGVQQSTNQPVQQSTNPLGQQPVQSNQVTSSGPLAGPSQQPTVTNQSAGGFVEGNGTALDARANQSTTSNAQQQLSQQQSSGVSSVLSQAVASNQGGQNILTNEWMPAQSQQPAQPGQVGLTPLQDTIKSNLMMLLQSSDIPPAIKETASQLINHITGQQMMLSTERNQSMFTHITMYVPIRDANGEQTTAIHVQTRRDRKGHLDAENCRIVFDLNMSHIGQTLVDMNVVNKIVTLNLWNDASYMPTLIDGMRPELVEAMQTTGYSLSSVKVTPFKDEKQERLDEVKAVVLPPDLQYVNARSYKGVDLKI